MRTYQIKIDEKLLFELKRILSVLPTEGVKLYNEKGEPVEIDSEVYKLSVEQKEAILEGIVELDRGEGISHENAVAELQAKYKTLNFKK